MLVPTQNVLGSSRADGGRVNTAADRFRLDQGKRALQKLLAEKRKAKAKRLKLSDYVRLYCTIFGGLLIIVGFSILIFLVPMKIDPALATLSYEFNPTPVILTVERVDFIKGISNIDWCSCTEACTRDVFECYHIIVSYNSLPGGRYVTSGLLEAQQMLVELDATEATDGTNTGSPASDIETSVSEREALESSESEHEALESSVSEHDALESSVSEHEALESSVSEGERNNPRRSENVSDDSLWSRTNHSISLLEINNSTSPDRRKRRLKRNTSVGHGCRYCLNCEVCSAKLLVNVKGCGYPPEVNCTEFLEKYGKPGRRLPGYYSSLDSSIALAEYDESLIRRELGEALGYTFGMMVLGVCIIVILHLPYKKLLAKIPGRKIRTSESEDQFRTVAKHYAHMSVADSISKVAARMIRLNRNSRDETIFNSRADISTASSTVSNGEFKSVAIISNADAAPGRRGAAEDSLIRVQSEDSGNNAWGDNLDFEPHLTFARLPPVTEDSFPRYPAPDRLINNDGLETNILDSYNNHASNFVDIDFPPTRGDWRVDNTNRQQRGNGNFNHNFVEIPEPVDRSGRFPVNKW